MQPGSRHWEGPGKWAHRGPGDEWAQGGRYLGFIGPGDPLNIVRIMLVIWKGKGEGPVGRPGGGYWHTGKPRRCCGSCSDQHRRVSVAVKWGSSSWLASACKRYVYAVL